MKFTVGKKYKVPFNLQESESEIMEYLDEKYYKIIVDGYDIIVLDKVGNEFKDIGGVNIDPEEECDLKKGNITGLNLHRFQMPCKTDFFIPVTHTKILELIKEYIPLNLSNLINFDKNIKEIEDSSISTLEKLYNETYLSEISDYRLPEYSGKISSYIYKLYYTSLNGNTYIKENYKYQRDTIRELVDILDTITRKADSDFYVFRKTRPDPAYEYNKIISGEITKEKMFGPISTTILFSFAEKWNDRGPCCIYLIKVPRDQNYLILNNVFTKTDGKLELNKESQYEVALAPGEITFTDIRKITINGLERVLCVCDYRSFTLEEFYSGFNGPIYSMKYSKKYNKKYLIEYKYK